MKLPYAAFQRPPTPLIPATTQYYPLAPLRVIGSSGDAFFHALLDTGADHCVLPKAVATHIGVTLGPQAQNVRSISRHTFPVLPGRVDLETIHAGQIFRWPATIGFSAVVNNAVLGHVGCLDYFYANFDPVAHEVELLPTPQFPGTLIGATP